jgi:fructose-1,6-bisphosphatase I
MTNPISLTQFILEQQRGLKDASVALSPLLIDIASACKQISHLVSRGELMNVLGSAESENIHGEVQKKLDIITNDIMINTLNWGGSLAGMTSEEADEIIAIPKQYPKGKYLALFDPLDGSSNIDVNLSILHCHANDEPNTEDFLQKGTNQVCAGFVLYGPSTLMILTTGNGVNGFTLDQDIGEFILTQPNIRIPEETAEFAINMSNQRFWEAPVQRYIDECLQGTEGPRGKNFNMRWIASLVAEVYRILTRGGVFLYPLDLRKPLTEGRLRIMYEANPMAFIIEQAGGSCSTGRERMLDIKPTSIHQRVPLILGSKNEVERIVAYHQESAN